MIRKINCVWVSIQKFKTGICSIAIADENAFKKACMDFLLCPDQGNKIEGVVLNRVRVSSQGGQTARGN